MSVLAACGDTAPPAARAAHPWLTAPPPADDGAVTLPAWLVHPLALERRAEAVAELGAEPYVQISPGSASHYAGSAVGVPAEMRPFLIRALAPPAAPATLDVVQSRHGLWVRVRAGAGEPLEAAPLVVLVDPTPQTVHVTVDTSASNSRPAGEQLE
ncbi:MAG: hypothetical protein RLW62_18995 [Gammaproteobacteria bacterium]